jgi:hypothetical protein
VTSARVLVLSLVSGTIIEKKIAVGDQVTEHTARWSYWVHEINATQVEKRKPLPDKSFR